MADLLQHAAEFSLHGSKLRAAIEIEDHLGKADIDAGQIEQVVNALMFNAREAMPNGGCVRVSAENVQIDQRASCNWAASYIRIAVSDQLVPGSPPKSPERFSILISRPNLPPAVSVWRSVIRSFASMAACSHLEKDRTGRLNLRLLSPRSQRQGGKRPLAALTTALSTISNSASW